MYMELLIVLGTSPYVVQTSGQPCYDQSPYCHSFDAGKAICSGVYLDWAKQNCQSFCNLCSKILIIISFAGVLNLTMKSSIALDTNKLSLITLVNVYVDLVVFTRIAGTS